MRDCIGHVSTVIPRVIGSHISRFGVDDETHPWKQIPRYLVDGMSVEIRGKVGQCLLDIDVAPIRKQIAVHDVKKVNSHRLVKCENDKVVDQSNHQSL